MKDLSTVSSNDDSTDDVTLDNVLHTGENNDREPDVEEEEEEEEKDDDKKSEKSIVDQLEEEDDDEDDNLDDETKLKNFITGLSGDDLSDDNKELKSQLLAKFKGTAINDQGQIVDANGNVVASGKEITEFVNSEEEVKLNDKGDQVDERGNVIKTKFQLAAENSLVNELHSESEYEFIDEEGNPKIYEDSKEGIKQYTNDVAEQIALENNQRFFSQNDELMEISKHLLSGGTVEDFKKPTDYNKIKVDDLSRDQKIKHIKDSFKISGMSDKRIVSMMKKIEDSNDVDEEAKLALEDLALRDKDQKVIRDQKFQESEKQRQEKVDNYWKSVNDTVASGKIKNLSIPDKDKGGFLSYVSEPVDKNGNTKEILDASKEEVDTKLLISYIRYKGFKMDDFINSKAATQKAISLRERMKRNAKLKDTPINDAKGITSKGNQKDVTLDDVL